jgi:hypothetical protein
VCECNTTAYVKGNVPRVSIYNPQLPPALTFIYCEVIFGLCGTTETFGHVVNKMQCEKYAKKLAF